MVKKPTVKDRILCHGSDRSHTFFRKNRVEKEGSKRNEGILLHPAGKTCKQP